MTKLRTDSLKTGPFPLSRRYFFPFGKKLTGSDLPDPGHRFRPAALRIRSVDPDELPVRFLPYDPESVRDFDDLQFRLVVHFTPPFLHGHDSAWTIETPDAQFAVI